jgi:nitroreductase
MLDVYEAVVERRSVRRFLPKAIGESTIRSIIAAASRAPSGQNMQPWQVHVVSGLARSRLSDAVMSAALAGRESLEYPYLPSTISEPFLSRRRKVGFDLYAIYGVDRHDMEGRKRANLRNFDFFGAPVGLFFVMDRDMGLGAWLDCGMFMQNVMVVARGMGLESCPQQSWCEYGAIVHEELHIPQSQIVVSGMALGYIDHDAAENALRTERAPLEQYVTWHR